MRQMQIHILGIGPVFWHRNEIGCSVECFRPKSSNSSSGQMPITVKEIVSSLKTGCFGEAQNIVIPLGRRLAILEVIGEAEYPRFVLGEKRSLLITADSGNPAALAATHIDAGDPTGNRSTIEQQINSIQAGLGVYETPLLTVTLPYQHSSHLSSTTLSISRNAEVHRYNEHPRQHSSPALQTKPFSFPSSHSWEISVQNRPRDGDEHVLQPGPRSG